MMPSPSAREVVIRQQALAWLDAVTDGGVLPVSRDELANGFVADRKRFPLIDRGRGIRRPQGWRAALSITTAYPKPGRTAPYNDDTGIDGLQRYKIRRGDRAEADNAGLRNAMLDDAPLAWFVGVRPALFQVIAPVYLVAEEADSDQFVMALTPAQRLVPPHSLFEESLKRYLLRQTRQRLHQPVFASQVMLAYTERCAVCSLHHRELLDAAHIVPDSKPHGLPIVPNGLALCKIHHAAFDRNILGVRPDCTIEIRTDILAEQDGPMFRHGLQDLHRRPLMVLPSRRAERPDPALLEERYAEFRAAS